MEAVWVESQRCFQMKIPDVGTRRAAPIESFHGNASFVRHLARWKQNKSWHMEQFKAEYQMLFETEYIRLWQIYQLWMGSTLRFVFILE